jgi:predicted Rossmann fold nucleotide-binding protein DprA/Smf involved in DNA uptake
MKYYAGIGSRETPKEICNKMTEIASLLEKQDFVLRSGGANGADSAFEKGHYHD